MLTAYACAPEGLRRTALPEGGEPPEGLVWIDLLRPTEEEEAVVERLLGIDVPTRAEMQEIEISSRLYEEGGAYFMTATLVARADSAHPEWGAVTFILARGRLVTVRYVEPNSFSVFPTRAEHQPDLCTNGEGVLLGLLETVIDRMADLLERIRSDVDQLSQSIFGQNGNAGGARPDHQATLRHIGRRADILSLVQESILGIDRLVSFHNEATPGDGAKELRGRYKALRRDLLSLRDYAAALANKLTFLLEATLGLVSIEQNNIIKIFSVVAVVFLPPTLIASIYGMNFHFMPELDWPFGYPMALALMLASAIAPYLYFKHRRWL